MLMLDAPVARLTLLPAINVTLPVLPFKLNDGDVPPEAPLMLTVNAPAAVAVAKLMLLPATNAREIAVPVIELAPALKD